AYYESGAIRECAEYNVIQANLIRGVSYFDEHDGAVVATFTILLALFTWGVWVQTSRTAKLAHATARAHLWAQRAGISFDRDANGNIVRTNATLTIRNLGETPGMAHRIKIHLYRWALGDWPDEPYYKDTINERMHFFKQDSEEHFGFEVNLPFTDHDLNDFRNGARVLILYGFIEYADVIDSNVRHRSGFAIRLNMSNQWDASESWAIQGPSAY